MLMLVLLQSSFVCSVLLFWFKTDVFVEYYKLLTGKEPFGYENRKPGETLPQLLFRRSIIEHGTRQYKFFIKGLTCVMCLAFWLSALVTLICLSPGTLFITYVVSIAMFLGFQKLLE